MSLVMKELLIILIILGEGANIFEATKGVKDMFVNTDDSSRDDNQPVCGATNSRFRNEFEQLDHFINTELINSVMQNFQDNLYAQSYKSQASAKLSEIFAPTMQSGTTSMLGDVEA